MKELITPEILRSNFQDARDLTRQVIEAFPEKELFEFSIGGMRPFSQMVEEFVMMVDYVFTELFPHMHFSLHTEGNFPKSKTEILLLWDKTTEVIDREWQQITDFTKELTLYQMTFSIAQWFLYLIENETHHRGQGYTYLRALDIEPPFFWGRKSFQK